MPGFLEDEASLSSHTDNGEVLNQMDLFQFLALALPPRDSNSEGVYHLEADRMHLEVPLFSFSAYKIYLPQTHS